MSTSAKLAGFTTGLVVLFGAAFALGDAVGPSGQPAGPTTATAGTSGSGHSHEGAGNESAEGGHAHGTDAGIQAEHPVGGLAVADQGYLMRRLSGDPVAGRPGELAFQIVGRGGLPVTSFVNTHDKPLHLIIARRDLAGFQHVHPTMAPDGTWRVPLTLADAGDYRAFADFVPDNRTDTLVLGTDLPVAGTLAPVPLPAPSTEAIVDGYTVRMVGRPTEGESSPVRFTISRDGVPVRDLDVYLAAYGHLVALRHGDLGYLHVHPEGGPGESPPGPEIGFVAELPSAGYYRFYLDFSHFGVVRTAEFTVHAGQTS